jgi:hypothetical protein
VRDKEGLRGNYQRGQKGPCQSCSDGFQPVIRRNLGFADDATQGGYAAKMKLFSFCFGFAHIAPPGCERQTETPA